MPFAPDKTSLSPKSEQNQETQKIDPNVIDASSSMPEMSGNRRVLQIEQSVHMGPLPSPDIMNAYGEETRKTILEMARAAQSHRHKRGEAEDARIDRGQRLSFVFAALCLGGGIILFWINENAAGWSMEGFGMAIALREIIAKAFEWINPDSRKRKEKRD